MVILETELKRFFILSAIKTKKDGGFGMYSKDVDNIWHTFILFTQEYKQFCKKYIGRFLHHILETDEIPAIKKEDVAQDFQQFLVNYQHIFNQEVHPIWFLDMVES